MFIHYAFLALSILYKSLALGQKILRQRELRTLINELHEGCDFGQGYKLSRSYFRSYKRRHGSMYLKYMFIHIVAIGINLLAFLGLNITLQNNYLDLPRHLSVQRNPIEFDDSLSLIFPPFVDCEINVK